MSETTPVTPDALKGHWVERLPEGIKPYARLARWDRPIGWWLLLWPCWWSAALASVASDAMIPNLWHMALFFIGAVAMRGAGCTYNDIVDRKIDAQVERTRNRPIPSGAVTAKAATIFMVVQSLIGFVVLIQFNLFAIVLGLGSLAVVAIYPFMKRVTSWPQFVLGLAFNWGALMGWAAVFGRIDAPALLLYGAGVVWTIAYDTIYAHQDRTDDSIIGVKSTARLFGDHSQLLIGLFFGAAVITLVGAMITAGAPIWTLTLLLPAALHAAWQVRSLDPDRPDVCLALFRSNLVFGWLVFGALIGTTVFAAL